MTERVTRALVRDVPLEDLGTLALVTLVYAGIIFAINRLTGGKDAVTY